MNRTHGLPPELRDESMIFIHCDAHPQRVPVATFANHVGKWSIMPGTPGMEAMVANTPILQADPTVGEVRARYRLRCRRCAREVQIREERLTPILDRLHTHGVTGLSLRGLHGIT